MWTRMLLLTAAVVGLEWWALDGSAWAETIRLERIVPPGAVLTYSEGGNALKTIDVPVGRVRVTIQYGDKVPLPRTRPAIRRAAPRPRVAQPLRPRIDHSKRAAVKQERME